MLDEVRTRIVEGETAEVVLVDDIPRNDDEGNVPHTAIEVAYVGHSGLRTMIAWVPPTLQLLDADGKPVPASDEEESGSVWFRGLDPDARFTLLFQHPYFQRNIERDVRPGTRWPIRLDASAGIELEVVEAVSGRSIQEYEMHVRFQFEHASPLTWKMKAKSQSPPEDRHFPIPARPFELIVLADGYAHESVRIEEFGPGDRREVRVELHPPVKLRGRVTLDDGETPISGAFVHLRRPGEAPSFHRNDVITSWEAPIPIVSLRSDDEGRFETLVSPGEYALHAIVDPWHTAVVDPLTIPAEGLEEEVQLVLPEHGELLGRITGVEPALLEGVRVQPHCDSEDWIDRARGGIRSTAVAEDGSFRLAPLPPGAREFFVFLPTGDSPTALGWDFDPYGSPRFDLGEATIALKGTTEAEFPAGDLWPSDVDVAFEVGDRPAAEYVVQIEPADGTVGGDRIVLDASGRGSFPFTAPGEYVVDIRTGESPEIVRNPWTLRLPETIVVPVAERIEVRRELPLTTERIRLVDAETGDPIADETIRGVRHTPYGFYTYGTTDADGWLELALPPGEHGLSRTEVTYRTVGDHRFPNEMPTHSATVHWTADGPVIPSVELKATGR